MLIDIRPDEVRESTGVPALVRGALGKGFAVPLRPLPTAVSRRCGPAVRCTPLLRSLSPARPVPACSLTPDSCPCRRVRKADEIAAQVTAATIADLKVVKSGTTRIIVMDRGDGQAIKVAKALETVGCRRPSVFSGGFRCYSG